MFNFDHLASVNTRPKRIPPPPTPLSFPPCPELPSSETVALPRDRLEALFRLKNLKFLTQDHLLSINLNVENVHSAESLVPESFLPPASWKQKPGANDDAGKANEPFSHHTLSNGAAVPGHEAFYNRMIELTYSNQDAYEAVSRRPLDKKPIRIAQFRRFWIDLQHVGSFWDASEDNLDYQDPIVKQAVESQDNMPSPMAAKKANTGVQSSRDPSAPQLRSAISENDKMSTSTGANDPPDGVPDTFSKPPVVYTGLRHSAGSMMPSKHREDMMRTFVEPIAWSFGCVLERTISQPYLHIGTTRLLADHTMRAFRGPQDRQRSRAKMVEGPLMALQCTHETDFADTRSPEYVARELGALLVIAQERHREGKTELLRGSGQWWAERRRWGGGTGDAVGVPLLEDDGSMPDAENGEQEEGSMSDSKPKRPTSKEVKQQMKKTLLARSHKSPVPIWEKRVDYIRIGKAQEDGYDTFLDLLTKAGAIDEATASNESWYGLWLSRSRWYNMLDPGDRIEIMCALWGVMGWLMRDMGPLDDRAPNPDEMRDM